MAVSRPRWRWAGSRCRTSKLYAVSANLGAYRGETALAGGVAFRLTDNATLNGSLGVGVDHGDVGGRVGVTFAW